MKYQLVSFIPAKQMMVINESKKGENKMATMKIILSNVEKVSPAYRPNENSIRINCDISHSDMEDIMYQICDQLGDKAFLKLAKRVIV
jgi:hypothetical protein